MTTCCPTPAPVGVEAANICTECATVTAAGASFDLPLILAAAGCTMRITHAWKTIRERRARAPRAALA